MLLQKSRTYKKSSYKNLKVIKNTLEENLQVFWCFQGV